MTDSASSFRSAAASAAAAGAAAAAAVDTPGRGVRGGRGMEGREGMVGRGGREGEPQRGVVKGEFPLKQTQRVTPHPDTGIKHAPRAVHGGGQCRGR